MRAAMLPAEYPIASSIPRPPTKVDPNCHNMMPAWATVHPATLGIAMMGILVRTNAEPSGPCDL